MLKIFRLLIVVVALFAVPQTQACDYTSSSGHIQGCLNTYMSGISCIYSTGTSCICNLFSTYIQCLAQTPCLGTTSRNSIISLGNSYQSMLSIYCTGSNSISYPVYRTRIYFTGGWWGVGYTISQQQYVQNCIRIFNALGYSTGVSGWCQTWSDYITYYWGSRKRQDRYSVDVEVPNDQFVPPSSQVNSLTLEYTNSEGSSTSRSVDGIDVEPQTVSGSSQGTGNQGTVVAAPSPPGPGGPQIFPTPPTPQHSGASGVTVGCLVAVATAVALVLM